jgi:hypothetical protein
MNYIFTQLTKQGLRVVKLNGPYVNIPKTTLRALSNRKLLYHMIGL